jgi:anti-anti-sigma factor
MSSSEPDGASSQEQLVVEVHARRRTALVALRGELDLVTVSKVAEVIDEVHRRPEASGTSCSDLRGLTFMDVPGLRELSRQNEYARTNHHNLALVRGTELVQRVLKLTGVDEQLILVDDPDDLVPPSGRPSRLKTGCDG